MPAIYLHAKNDNMAVRERKRSVVNLRNASVVVNLAQYPNSVRYAFTRKMGYRIVYQPIRGRRSKKYHAYFPHWGRSM